MKMAQSNKWAPSFLVSEYDNKKGKIKIFPIFATAKSNQNGQKNPHTHLLVCHLLLDCCQHDPFCTHAKILDRLLVWCDWHLDIPDVLLSLATKKK